MSDGLEGAFWMRGEPGDRDPWMQTFTGHKFWPLDPRLEDVRIEDIAHALAYICRFGGHTSSFCSIAEHSIYVSEICDPEDALAGLFHDAAEAYVGDMIRPLKDSGSTMAEQYCLIEKRVLSAVFARFQIDHMSQALDRIKVADTRVLLAEAHRLMGDPDWARHAARTSGLSPYPHNIQCHSPRRAEELFLSRYHELLT